MHRRTRAAPDEIRYRFAPLPVAAIDDAHISDGAFRMYALLMAVRHGDLATISEKRSGERLKRSKRTAHTWIHELIDAGYIEQVDTKNGRRCTYRIIALTGANGFTGTTPAPSEPVQNLADTSANGFTGTSANGFTNSRDIDINSRANETENENERLARVIAEIAGRP